MFLMGKVIFSNGDSAGFCQGGNSFVINAMRLVLQMSPLEPTSSIFLHSASPSPQSPFLTETILLLDVIMAFFLVLITIAVFHFCHDEGLKSSGNHKRFSTPRSAPPPIQSHSVLSGLTFCFTEVSTTPIFPAHRACD